MLIAYTPQFVFADIPEQRNIRIAVWRFRIYVIYSYSYLTPQSRHRPFGLSFNQYGLYPHTYRFISPFSSSL